MKNLKIIFFPLVLLIVLPLTLPCQLSAGRIHDAIRNNNFEEVKQCIENNKNSVHEKADDDHQATPLHLASYFGLLNIVKLLIENDANLEAKAKGGWTPLSLACFERRLKVVKFLIEQGADLTAKNHSNDTPLNYINEERLAFDDWFPEHRKELLTSLLYAKDKNIVSTKKLFLLLFQDKYSLIQTLIDAATNKKLVLNPQDLDLSSTYNSEVKDKALLIALFGRFLNACFSPLRPFDNMRNSTDEEQLVCLELFEKTPEQLFRQRSKNFYRISKNKAEFSQKLFTQFMIASNNGKAATEPRVKKLTDLTIYFKS